MPDPQETLAIVELYRQRYMAAIVEDNFDRILWERLNILSATVNECGRTSKVTFSIVVPRTFGNHVHTMHTGALATLFDGLTSSCLALFSKPGYWNGSEVTRALEITCFKPVPLDEQLNAECEVVHAGKRLASLRGVITRACDGAVLAACQHEKFNSTVGSRSKL